MANGITEIPPISDPMGRYWEQPPREKIAVDDDYALMTEADWKALHHYDHSIPTATYVGKMWGCTRNDGERFFRWYHEIVGNEITIETRKVITV